MGRRDSLSTLAAFEDEAARKREAERSRRAPQQPLKPFWGVLTATFRLPQTFVERWSSMKLGQRRRRRRALLLAAVVGLAGTGYLVFTLPGVRAWVDRALESVQAASEPYAARLRSALAPTEHSPPTAAETTSVPEDAWKAAPEKRGKRGQKQRRGKHPGRTKQRPDLSLNADAIVATVRQHTGSLAPCVQRAQAARELVPGKHTLVMSWVVLPSGAVRNPRLVGPRSVLGTSLPACFAARVAGWHFPSAARSTTVENFPIPVTVR